MVSAFTSALSFAFILAHQLVSAQTYGPNLFPVDMSQNGGQSKSGQTGANWHWDFDCSAGFYEFQSSETSGSAQNANEFSGGVANQNCGIDIALTSEFTPTLIVGATYYLSLDTAKSISVTVTNSVTGDEETFTSSSYLSPHSAGPFSFVFHLDDVSKFGLITSLQQVTGYNGGVISLYRRHMNQIRRQQAAQDAVRYALCPRTLTACPTSPNQALSKGYECIDTQSELNSCGGCIYAANSTAVDCEAMQGVRKGSVTCEEGRCVALACDKRRGYGLVDGVCLK